MSQFFDATPEQIDETMVKAWAAFQKFRLLSIKERARFMKQIAIELENLGDELIKTAAEETNLPEARLRNERGRTIFQLNNYAEASEQGNWLEARIDTADSQRNPPKPDVRKMLIPLGPVAVFGASNFPFAYSTAGGDTACAFAAGCPVVVKAHPAHPRTSELQARAIFNAIKICKLPDGIFAHIHGGGFETGRALVQHQYTKAVGFTGSFQGGKALFDWANQRKEPIPVFSEMGSVNPVFILPGKLKENAKEIASLYAVSITLGVGQFCTNPGLLIGIDGEELQSFIGLLKTEVSKVVPQKMLHPGIAKNYFDKRKEALSQEGVVAETDVVEQEGSPSLASATGEAFLNNPVLHREVFGPYSLVVRCKDVAQMIEVARAAEGQITSTLMATEEEMRNNPELVESIKDICGRFVYNSVPTGVEVCLSMHHGGPFPATTDSRFTSVGADGIKRFARPMCFQNWPDSLLPDELKDTNPLGIWRTINTNLTKDAV